MTLAPSDTRLSVLMSCAASETSAPVASCRNRLAWQCPVLVASQNFGSVVYETMWGESELSVTGNLKSYDRTDRLAKIAIRVLLACGRYDEASPETTTIYQRLMPDAQIAVFENSAHVPHFEDKEAYLQTVRDFLR